jgi:hypothetical protein
LLVAAAFALSALRERRTRDAAVLATSAAPRVAWSLWLAIRGVPTGANGGGAANLTWPFGGIAQHVMAFARSPRVTGSTAISLAIALPLLAMMGREVWIWTRTTVMARFDAVAWGAGPSRALLLATTLTSALAVCASAQVWSHPGGFARAFEVLSATSVLAALQRRDRVTLTLSFATVAHALNVVADHVVR